MNTIMNSEINQEQLFNDTLALERSLSVVASSLRNDFLNMIENDLPLGEFKAQRDQCFTDLGVLKHDLEEISLRYFHLFDHYYSLYKAETKNYVITEDNEHEGEKWSYIVKLTDEEFSLVKQHFAAIEEEWGYEVFKVEEGLLLPVEVQMVNRYASAGYMDAMGYYKLAIELTEKNTTSEDQIFYKAGCLKKVTFNEYNNV